MTDAMSHPPPPLATPVHPSIESSLKTNGATVAIAAATQYWDEHSNLNSKERTPLVEAANLIAALDTAYADMNSLAASAAREVETARRNAREASEVARRYRSRSYPKESMFVGNGHSISPATARRLNDSRHDESEDHHQQHQQQTPRNGNIPVPTDTPAVTTGSDDTLGTNGSRPSDWGIFSPADQPFDSTSDVLSATSGSYLKKRKNYKLRSSPSVEQLAQSHAEDVLSLSLELERAKLAYQSEQTAHSKTKSALAEAISKNSQLEAQIEKLLSDMETQREDHGRKADLLEEDLERAKMRVQAAEVDAQEALDLAKSFAEHRDELEDSLQLALQEIQVLRGLAPSNALPPGRSDHYPHHNLEELHNSGTASRSRPPPPKGPPPRRPSGEKKGVRFADDLPTARSSSSDSATTTTSASAPPLVSQSPRTMVAAGRQLLQRHTAAAPGASTTMVARTPDQQALVIINPQKSAERRNRLRERLQAAGSEIVIASPPPKPPTAVPPPPSPRPPPYDSKAIQKIAMTLRESAQRIGLTGHWWAKTSSSSKPEDVEIMTRSYCQSVEVKLERHANDNKELQSLCSYLEGNLVVRQDVQV